jgi:hypothetical protein
VYALMMEENLRLVAFEQATPSQELVGQMKLDDHSACQADHIVHRRLRVSWVVLHVVMRGVGRVLLLVRVRRARLGGNRWIYRYIVVRLELLRLMMVIGLTIRERH